jgi:hypothetical protein
MAKKETVDLRGASLANKVCTGFTTKQLNAFGEGGLKRFVDTVERAIADYKTVGRNEILGMDINAIERDLKKLRKI